MVAVTASASGRNILPSTSPRVKIGKKTIMIMAVAKKIGAATSWAARRIRILVVLLSPFSAVADCNLSTMIIVASTIIPKAIAIPPKESRSPGIF